MEEADLVLAARKVQEAQNLLRTIGILEKQIEELERYGLYAVECIKVIPRTKGGTCQSEMNFCGEELDQLKKDILSILKKRLAKLKSQFKKM